MKMRLFALACLMMFIVTKSARAAEDLPPDVVAAFGSANRIMLYSLDPTFHEGSGFHGYRILSHQVVGDASIRQGLAVALQKDVRAGGPGALCFEPHHGVRLITGRTILDLVVCYQCGHVHIHSGNQPVRRVGIADHPAYLDGLLATKND